MDIRWARCPAHLLRGASSGPLLPFLLVLLCCGDLPPRCAGQTDCADDPNGELGAISFCCTGCPNALAPSSCTGFVNSKIVSDICRASCGECTPAPPGGAPTAQPPSQGVCADDASWLHPNGWRCADLLSQKEQCIATSRPDSCWQDTCVPSVAAACRAACGVCATPSPSAGAGPPCTSDAAACTADPTCTCGVGTIRFETNAAGTPCWRCTAAPGPTTTQPAADTTTAAPGGGGGGDEGGGGDGDPWWVNAALPFFLCCLLCLVVSCGLLGWRMLKSRQGAPQDKEGRSGSGDGGGGGGSGGGGDGVPPGSGVESGPVAVGGGVVPSGVPAPPPGSAATSETVIDELRQRRDRLQQEVQGAEAEGGVQQQLGGAAEVAGLPDAAVAGRGVSQTVSGSTAGIAAGQVFADGAVVQANWEGEWLEAEIISYDNSDAMYVVRWLVDMSETRLPPALIRPRALPPVESNPLNALFGAR